MEGVLLLLLFFFWGGGGGGWGWGLVKARSAFCVQTTRVYQRWQVLLFFAVFCENTS